MKIGFLSLLTIVFIVLELTGTIDWSWLCVLDPMWISALVLLVLTILAAIADSKKTPAQKVGKEVLKGMEK